MHALNNPFQASYFSFLRRAFCRIPYPDIRAFFQGKTTFTRHELNGITTNLLSDNAGRSLSHWFSPHHNSIFGNYDVNVLISAVQSRGGEVNWFDPRKADSCLELQNTPKALTGIILNHPSDKFGRLWKGRHWATLKNINGVWYDLDGYLKAPAPFLGGEDEVKQFLKKSFAGGSEAFLVYKKDANDATDG